MIEYNHLYDPNFHSTSAARGLYAHSFFNQSSAIERAYGQVDEVPADGWSLVPRQDPILRPSTNLSLINASGKSHQDLSPG